MPLLPGSRLGPYDILAPIGAGGMGEVWKARDSRLDRIVAVKVCAEQFNERFEREARAVAALNHPHICTLHDIGPNYLVMEFIEGQALKSPMPLAQALKYAAQICDALLCRPPEEYCPPRFAFLCSISACRADLPERRESLPMRASSTASLFQKAFLRDALRVSAPCAYE
jgi:serine/threonine protein kinase